MSAFFGPGGNSEAFKLAGKKSTVEAPEWLASIGLDAYEYEAGNGLAATPATLRAIGKEAAIHISNSALSSAGRTYGNARSCIMIFLK